jgi:hypothetical protein
MAAATATPPFPAAATDAYAAPSSFAPRPTPPSSSFAPPAAPPPSSSASSSAVSAVTSRVFYALGAYVGLVSALIWCGFDLFFTVGLGAASVPFIFYDALSEIYKAPIGHSLRTAGEGVGGRTCGAGAPRHRGGAKKVAESPVATMMMRGEAAGAPSGYEYGATGRGLLD